jgi:hypothetical protein
VTKKDYELIASVLARFTNLTTPVEIGATATAIADSLANRLMLDNPRFKRDTFLAACDCPARYFAQDGRAA